MAASIPTSVFKFLKTLKGNNNREWFALNKEDYQAEHLKVIEFADGLLAQLSKQDNIETANGKKSLHRIYRDTRFSKDKTPYKNNWSGGFKRATKQLRGGYYFHLEPGNTYVAGGFFSPNSEDLGRIRNGIDFNLDEFKEITSSPSFIDYFGEIIGEKVKTAPKGYAKDNPGIEFLRLKQFVIKRNFSDSEALNNNFIEDIVKTYKGMQPFFDFMSDVLTTDANGTPIC